MVCPSVTLPNEDAIEVGLAVGLRGTFAGVPLLPAVRRVLDGASQADRLI
jgi:hypothetical protein